MIEISIGSLLISFAISYAWWVKVRLICLRQDIYDIRDSLYDAALKLDAFDDPAYKEAREHMNAIAILANLISIPVVITATSQKRTKKKRAKSSIPEMQACIDLSIEKCAYRIGCYLLRESLSGWIVTFVIAITKVRHFVETRLCGSVEYWLNSSSPDDISKESKNIRRMNQPFLGTTP